VASNKDLARRILIFLEDRRVLVQAWEDREDAEFCRQSADQIRNFLTLEIMNVKGGGELEACLKQIRLACRTFVSAAGSSSQNFLGDHSYFSASLRALRDAVGSQISDIGETFKVEIPLPLQAIVPRQDLSWLPGYTDQSEEEAPGSDV